MNLGLNGRRAIVTGASRGIGASIARVLRDEGVKVAMIARPSPDLDAMASELGGPSFAVPVEADLSTAAGVSHAVQAALDSLGGVDILVNNAGASPFGSFDEIDDGQWRDAIDLKLLGYIRVSREVIPYMKRAGAGRILNIVGIAGKNATAGYTLGCLNAALLHLTKTLADQLAGEGISVVALNPGLTSTERALEAMAAWANAAGVDAEQFREQYLRSSVPAGRFAAPEEIGRLAAFLVSDHATYITGSSVDADGGARKGGF